MTPEERRARDRERQRAKRARAREARPVVPGRELGIVVALSPLRPGGREGESVKVWTLTERTGLASCRADEGYAPVVGEFCRVVRFESRPGRGGHAPPRVRQASHIADRNGGFDAATRLLDVYALFSGLWGDLTPARVLTSRDLARRVLGPDCGRARNREGPRA